MLYGEVDKEVDGEFEKAEFKSIFLILFVSVFFSLFIAYEQSAFQETSVERVSDLENDI